MPNSIRFDGQVVAITGAGQGLGRAHALEIARRGGRVLVNDVGSAPDGSGDDDSVSARVVQEIEAADGEALTDDTDVRDPEAGERIVARAVERWGRCDAVVSNAGILRDRSFAKLSDKELADVLDVHLWGAFNVCRPAFRWMKNNGGGRLVLTTSASALFGNFGQSNYAAAKLALVGLTKVLAIEGEKYGITANALAPVAATRLSLADRNEKEERRMGPGRVSPLVALLCHASCPVNGETFLAGGGFYARAAMLLGAGWRHDDPDGPTAEDVRDHIDEIRSLDNTTDLPHALAVSEVLA